eukprot:CAMPEP_0175171822 /NCGR_PEP_ID=MMETSP0087-20121206/31066_1 /TAXON_ID=136419 /ORGANISM="Unknown Unknown, Strain D1" /LENGTH=672 /DNA_ID=CAMNT_0016462775 /DNA_START=1508 /DNA_END=3526 /DNA_ORIENTATION=-
MKEVIQTDGFATVQRAVNRKSSQEFAVRTIAKESPHAANLENEVRVLQRVSHPHIVRLLEVFETAKHVHLVMDRQQGGGGLYHRLLERGTFPENEVSGIIRSTCSALCYLHSQGIVHRRLRPESLVFDVNGSIRLTNFGHSETVAPGHKPQLPTQHHAQHALLDPGYTAPEVLQQQPYCQAVDMWSLGVVLFTLLAGHPPFAHEDKAELCKLVCAGSYSFSSPSWEGVSCSAKDLVSSLLTVDPAHRCTARNALRHPFLSSPSTGSHEPPTTTTPLMRGIHKLWLLRRVKTRFDELLQESEGFDKEFSSVHDGRVQPKRAAQRVSGRYLTSAFEVNDQPCSSFGQNAASSNLTKQALPGRHLTSVFEAGPHQAVTHSKPRSHANRPAPPLPHSPVNRKTNSNTAATRLAPSRTHQPSSHKERPPPPSPQVQRPAPPSPESDISLDFSALQPQLEQLRFIGDQELDLGHELVFEKGVDTLAYEGSSQDDNSNSDEADASDSDSSSCSLPSPPRLPSSALKAAQAMRRRVQSDHSSDTTGIAVVWPAPVLCQLKAATYEHIAAKMPEEMPMQLHIKDHWRATPLSRVAPFVKIERQPPQPSQPVAILAGKSDSDSTKPVNEKENAVPGPKNMLHSKEKGAGFGTVPKSVREPQQKKGLQKRASQQMVANLQAQK